MVASIDIVTITSDESRWNALYSQWINEKKPGYVVTGSKTYRVMKKPGNVIEFHEISARDLYETVSF